MDRSQHLPSIANKILTTESNTTFMEMQENGLHELSKTKYLQVENRNLMDKIEDMETTLKLNKEIVQNIFMTPNSNDPIIASIQQETNHIQT